MLKARHPDLTTGSVANPTSDTFDTIRSGIEHRKALDRRAEIARFWSEFATRWKQASEADRQAVVDGRPEVAEGVKRTAREIAGMKRVG
jgi:hypothetical protein